MSRAKKTDRDYKEPPPFVWYKFPHYLQMKCLLCAKIGVNPGARGCQVFDRKPEDIYYENANCPHFERADNDQAKRWLNAYVWKGAGYIPREDDTPPPGWEQINIRKCGPHWRSVTAATRKRMEELAKGIY